MSPCLYGPGCLNVKWCVLSRAVPQSRQPPPPAQNPLHTSTPPTHPPINPKIVWSDEYLPSKPLSCLGLYSSVRWPNPHQKDRAPSRPHLYPFLLSCSLFLSLYLSTLLSQSLSLACVPAAHSGSHLVFLIWFYMSPRTHVLSLSLSVACSLALPPPSPSLSLSC